MVKPGFLLFLTLTLGWMSAVSMIASDSSSQAQPKLTPRPRKSDAAAKRSSANLRLDVKLVLVPVSVTDAYDRPITTLTKESFRLLEDGVEQRITSFAKEESPVSLGLVFDSSGSMKNRITASVEALTQFFKTSLPGDEYFVVQFADQARLLGGFTTSPDEIFSRLGLVQARGWTALLDAVAMAAHQMRAAKNRRRVLLILSDGNDNNSRFSEAEIKSMVVEGDLRVYGIALSYRPRVLQQLAEETGGNVLVAQSMAELPNVVQRLSDEIRWHYLLGYSSSNPYDGKYHKVKVDLVQPQGAAPLRASWRRGYYAPGE